MRLLLVLSFLASVLAGCTGVEITPASASGVRNITQERVMYDPQTGKPYIVRSTDSTSMSAHGAGLVGDKGTETAGFKGTAPNLKMPGDDDAGGASGGDSDFDVSRFFNTGEPLIYIGALCIIGGALMIWKVSLQGGLLVAGAGFAFVAAGVYTWLLLVGAVLLLGGLGWYAWKTGFFREAGRTLIAAQKEAGVEETVAKKVDNHATGTDVAAIKALKAMEA